MSSRGTTHDSGLLSATADVASAVVAIAVVVGVPLSAGNDLLGTPLSTQTLTVLVCILAVGGAYPFVAGGWPLAKLTDFALATVLAIFGLSALVAVGLLALGGGLQSDSPVSTAVTVAVVVTSFAVAAGYVRRRERRHVASPDEAASGP